MATNEEMIKQMYGSNLTSQKEQLKTNYEAAVSNLDQQKVTNQKATEANLRRAALDAQKAQMNNEEYYAASGLSSGAKAQARLAQGNQLQANLATLRASQQEAEAAIEQQRGLLAKEYASAIQKAQADNDLELAKALYEEAQRQEAILLAQQEAEAAALAAQAKIKLTSYHIPDFKELEDWEDRFNNATSEEEAQYYMQVMAGMGIPAELYSPMYNKWVINRDNDNRNRVALSNYAEAAKKIGSVLGLDAFSRFRAGADK